MELEIKLHPYLEPLVEVAALAICDLTAPRDHGRDCLLGEFRKALTEDCTCWVLERSRESAKAGLIAVFAGSVVAEVDSSLGTGKAARIELRPRD